MFDLKRKSTVEDQWFSVDYSAATDGLSWEYSGSIFQRVIGGLPLEDQMMAMKVLGPHSLHYPVPGSPGRREYRGEQRNGQLMGSILSFPILCLANLGVYLLATNSYQQGWTDEERLNHVLVNGDDMVYSCHPDYWDVHKSIAGKVGLEMSVGKAYIHPVYANINSTSVHYDLRVPFEENFGKANTPYQIDYLNSGLFYGQRKVQEASDINCVLLNGELVSRENPWSRVDLPEKKIRYLLQQAEMNPQDSELGLVSTINWIMQGSLPGRQKGLMKKILSVQSKKIKAECTALLRHNGKVSLFTRNLFLPLCLGGMGVQIPPKFKVEVKPIQLKVANFLKKVSSMDLSSQLPLPGYPVSALETVQNMPWSRSVLDSCVYRATSTSAFSCIPKKALFGFHGIPFAPNPSTFSL